MTDSRSEFDVWSYVARLGIRLRPVSDTFFLDGDAVCAMRTCQYITQEDCEEFLHVDYKEFICTAPGCTASFSQLIDSEAHYNAVHRHSCSVCKKSLPTAHLLELHVIENHDTYFEVLSTKKPSFECFVEKCNLKFWSARDRRQHAIDDHSYPADFKFDSHKRINKKDAKTKTDTRQTIRTAEEMEVDESVITTKFLKNDVRVRNSLGTPRKARPVSAFITSKPTAAGDKPGMPPTSRTPPTYPRRFSLNTASTPKESSPPVKRAPLSLARMGERMTNYGGSSVDVRSDDAPVPITGSVSTTALPTASCSTLPRTRIPSPTKSAGRSSTSTPVKKTSHDESPSKSRIPVLRSSSYKVPKNISFGFGVPKVFPRKSSSAGKHWHQTKADVGSKTASPLENSNFDEMKMALD